MNVLREKIELPKRDSREGTMKVYRLKVRRTDRQRYVIISQELRGKMGVKEGDHLLVSETEEGDFYLEKEERD